MASASGSAPSATPNRRLAAAASETPNSSPSLAADSIFGIAAVCGFVGLVSVVVLTAIVYARRVSAPKKDSAAAEDCESDMV